MNAKLLLLPVLGAFSLSLSALAEGNTDGSPNELEFIGIKPQTIFAKESTHVTVTAKPKQPLGPDEGLFLVELDEDGSTKKIIGEMQDLGRWGDTVKGDGFYSKQFQVFDKKGSQKRRYTAVKQTAKAGAESPTDRDPALLAEGDIVSVEILRRPTVFEVVSRVWQKIVR